MGRMKVLDSMFDKMKDKAQEKALESAKDRLAKSVKSTLDEAEEALFGPDSAKKDNGEDGEKLTAEEREAAEEAREKQEAEAKAKRVAALKAQILKERALEAAAWEAKKKRETVEV